MDLNQINMPAVTPTSHISSLIAFSLSHDCSKGIMTVLVILIQIPFNNPVNNNPINNNPINPVTTCQVSSCAIL